MVEEAETGEAVMAPEDFAYARNAEKNCLIKEGINAPTLNVLIADTQ